MPVLPSYRNQSIDLHSKLTGFYIRATLALNGLNLRICRQSFLFFTLLRVWMSRSAISPLILRNSSITLFSSTYYSTDVGIPTTSFSLLLLRFQKLLTIIAKKNCIIDVWQGAKHSVESVRMRSVSGTYFPAFGLNTGKHRPGKLRIRKFLLLLLLLF